MKTGLYVCALALGAALIPAAAIADDPHDPLMRSAAARARDKAIIRGLNLRELAHVRARDAQYVQGWQAYRDYHQGGGRVLADRGNAAARNDYERRMASWRQAVAACEAGRYEYCAN